MNLVLISLAVLAVAGAALWVARALAGGRAPGAPAAAAPPARAARAASAASAASAANAGSAATSAAAKSAATQSAAAPAARPPASRQSRQRATDRAAALGNPPPAEALPPELACFSWLGPETLPPARRQALLGAIHRMPRPPAALHKLLSPQFLDRASSADLAELITGEAQIAARVLATVNSPLYGLQRPVTSIGQAVTFLGLNTVRGICLRYLLDDSFKPRTAALKMAYDQIWTASTLASELCAKLAQRLALPDSGALVAQVLLSFIGHLATASLLAPPPAGTAPATSLLDRMRTAQDQLGLGAGEIGGLLLQQWGLPASIACDVRDIDHMLVTPVGTLLPQRGQRLAVAYLCARLGERLAGQAPAQLPDLTGCQPITEPGADFFHLRGHLAAAPLARLPEHLHAADLNQALHTLRQAMQTRG